MANTIRNMDFSSFSEDESLDDIIQLLQGLPSQTSDLQLLNTQIATLHTYIAERGKVVNIAREAIEGINLEGLLSAMERRGETYREQITQLENLDFLSLTDNQKTKVSKLLQQLQSNIGGTPSQLFLERWDELQSLVPIAVGIDGVIDTLSGAGDLYEQYILKIKNIDVSDFTNEQRIQLNQYLADMKTAVGTDLSAFNTAWASVLSMSKIDINPGIESQNSGEEAPKPLDRSKLVSLQGVKITPENFLELKEDVLRELNAQSLDGLSNTEKKEVDRFFEGTLLYAQKVQKEISDVSKLLDDGYDQLDEQSDTGAVSITFNDRLVGAEKVNQLRAFLPGEMFKGNPLNSGGEFTIDFASKEDAVLFLSTLTTILADASARSYNIDGWILNGIAEGGMELLSLYNTMYWKAIDGVYNVWDFFTDAGGLAIGSIVFAGAGYAGISYLNKFLREVNTGVSREKFDSLNQEIDRSIKIFRDAGKGDEVKNLIKLQGDLVKVYQETAAGVLDNEAQTRQVYMLLQKFRGTPGMDVARFTMANVGNFFDGDFGTAGPEGKNKFIYTSLDPRDIGKSLWNIYRAPFTFLVKAINKGADGGIGGWNFQSKGAVILNYIDVFKESSAHLDTAFGIVDSMDGLTSAQKQEIKGQILDEYRGNTPGVKTDPLLKWKLDSGVDIKTLGEYVSEHLIAERKSPLGDTPGKREIFKGIGELSGFRYGIVLSYLKEHRMIVPKKVSLDEITARILTKKINAMGLGEQGDNSKILARLQQEEAVRVNIEKDIEVSKKILSTFIHYSPSISSTSEKILLQRLELEGSISPSGDVFTKSILQVIEEEIGEVHTMDDIKVLATEYNSRKIDLQSKDIAEITNSFRKLCQEKGKDASRVDILTSAMRENNTFYKPHLSMLIQEIYKNGNIKTFTEIEIKAFIDMGDAGGFREEPIDFLRSIMQREGVDSNLSGAAKATTERVETTTNGGAAIASEADVEPRGVSEIASALPKIGDLYDRAILIAENSGDLELARILASEKSNMIKKALNEGKVVDMTIVEATLKSALGIPKIPSIDDIQTKIITDAEAKKEEIFRILRSEGMMKKGGSVMITDDVDMPDVQKRISELSNPGIAKILIQAVKKP